MAYRLSMSPQERLEDQAQRAEIVALYDDEEFQSFLNSEAFTSSEIGKQITFKESFTTLCRANPFPGTDQEGFDNWSKGILLYAKK